MNPDSTHCLRAAHEAMRGTLKRAMREPGELGAAARRVAMLADGHFLREEKFLVPLLELLPALASGERGPHPSRAAKMLQGLKPALDQFAAEHAALAGALRELMVAAEAARKAEYFDLAEELMLHNRTEEEVLYPAAMVAGNFVRLLNAEQ